MPPLVRRYVKTSFAFLLAGLGLGGFILVSQFGVGSYPSRLLITAHAHLLLVGFMLMMVMGVATWMFPRPARDDARYRPGLAEAVYWILTLATALRALAEVLAGAWPSAWLRAGIGRGARPTPRRHPLRGQHVVAGPHAARGNPGALTRFGPGTALITCLNKPRPGA